MAFRGQGFMYRYIKNIDKSELVCLIRTNLCKIKVSDSTNLDN